MAAGDEQDGVGVEFGVAEVVTDVPGDQALGPARKRADDRLLFTLLRLGPPFDSAEIYGCADQQQMNARAELSALQTAWNQDIRTRR